MNRTRVPARTRAAAALLVASALFAPSAPAAEPAAPLQKVVAIEGITEYRLDNGLRVLLFPDASSPTVTVNLTVFVGSRHEGYGETGMAHLLEHMVFKGTPRHPDIPKALKEHGANFNGTTWLDRTNYYETMPATDANLEFGLRLEADRLVNSLIRREDLASEMTVVRNEFEMGENDPESILSQRMTAVAYEWHNYGKSTIGNRSDIERVPIENLQAFYRKFYQPDNALLVIAGRFDEAKAKGYVAKHFGALKRPERKLDKTYTEEPAQDGERTVVLRRVGKVGVVGAVYHVPAGSHPDYAAVEVLNRVLVAEPAGRLYKALVESKKATQVSGSAYPLHDPGVLEVLVQVDRAAPLEVVRDALLEALDRVVQEKVTPEEVERAKRQLLKNREQLVANSQRLAVSLSDWAGTGDWRLFFLHRDRLEKVTADDVARVAAQYLQKANRTVGLYVPSDKPERAVVAAAPNVAELVKDYKGREAVATGEVFDPTPENVEKRVQRSQLPGGVKVAFLSKKTRGETAHARLTLRYGNENSLKGLARASQFLGPLLTRGTAKYNRQQIQDAFDKLGARVNVTSQTPGEVSVSIQAKRATLPETLALLGELLRGATFPQAEFDILKREVRDDLLKATDDPQALSIRALERRLKPYPSDDVRYVPTHAESVARLEAVTRDTVVKLYAEQLGATAGEFVVVGDFDVDGVRAVLTKALDGWQSAVPYQRIARPARTDVEGGRETINTPDKENALYVAAHLMALTDADPDCPNLEVGNFLFGGGILSSRLANRVRQKDGLSYGVQSVFTADGLDPSARFLLYAICNPQNVEKVDRAIAEELDRLLKSGTDADEVATARKALLDQQKVQRAQDAGLAALLAERLSEGRTLAYDAAFEEKVAAATPESVMAAVRKHFQPKRLVIIHAGDFKKGSGAK